jgi:hypothetical protein
MGYPKKGTVASVRSVIRVWGFGVEILVFGTGKRFWGALGSVRLSWKTD